MTEQTTWTEDSSALYRQLANIAVPRRAEQIAALLMLIPFDPQETFRVVELASGEGILASAILRAFPRATLLALDGSDAMREATSQRLRTFGDRFSVGDFDMHASGWYPGLEGAHCVVSSLCVHHLDGEEKQGLFRAVRSRLAERAVFLLADLVAPQRPEARALFAATWDQAAQRQSIEHTGSVRPYDQLFAAERWNYYRFDDPLDQPSALFDQLQWLKAAGFRDVDCFWMSAGHALFGGYVGDSVPGEALTYDAAVRAAHEALADGEVG